ncbi:GspH/FimT family pseudopilin [Phytopseudomonas dryadis]|nr:MULTISPECIES: GspH/FimT family pseudopilin [Pseudomonas]
MHNQRNTGFTLIELMIVVSVLAIFVSIALPAFNNLIEGNRLASTANEFQTLLISARSDAVTRRTPISVSQENNTWSTGERQLDIPDSISVTADKTTITFNPNGTATESSTTFTSSNTGTTYTIKTKLPGLVQKTQG